MISLEDRPNDPGLYLVRYHVRGKGAFGSKIWAVSWADAQRQADELGFKLDGKEIGGMV